MNESIAQMILGKPIHLLEQADIVNFFQKERRETNIIEFKSYKDFPVNGTTKSSRDKDKLNHIICTLCGFLNSDGGILIWGAPEGQNDEANREKFFKGNITPVNCAVEQDQFINKIVSEISPMPLRILFRRIDLLPDSFLYVFEVMKSEFSPHQFKGTYYIRLDGSTRPAPHHYVEALIKRVSFPKLEGYSSFGKMRDYKDFAAIPMVLTLHNRSRYINEKNLQYRIVANCDIFDPNKYPDAINLQYGCDLEKNAKSVLHCNMPYFDEFLIVTNRYYNRNPTDIHIIITFWGDMSPVIISRYELQFFNGGRGSTAYEIISKTENKYLFEKQDELM